MGWSAGATRTHYERMRGPKPSARPPLGPRLSEMRPKASASKPCLSCGQTKPLEDFHRSPVSRDGRVARCKSCRNAESKVYREGSARAEADAEERGDRITRHEDSRLLGL
jgi:hypothetical protein